MSGSSPSIGATFSGSSQISSSSPSISFGRGAGIPVNSPRFDDFRTVRFGISPISIYAYSPAYSYGIGSAGAPCAVDWLGRAACGPGTVPVLSRYGGCVCLPY